MKQATKNAKPVKALQPENTEVQKPDAADKTLNTAPTPNKKPLNRFLEASCDCV